MKEIVEMECPRCESNMKVEVTEFVSGKRQTLGHPAESPDASFSIVQHNRLVAPQHWKDCSLTDYNVKPDETDKIMEAIVSHFASKLEPDFEG